MKKTFAAVAAVTAGALALAGGSAVAETGDRASAATITMELGHHGPKFGGDSEIIEGEKLKIVNLTDPGQIGPHTFSLVEKGDRPRTNPEVNDCLKLKGICGSIFEAHEVDKKFNVHEPLVDNGDEGWDEPFTEDAPGDSWFTETKRENLVQVVSPEAGRKLFFFCIVHPDMQGKLTVATPE